MGDVSTDCGHDFGSAWTHYIAVGVALWVSSAYEAGRVFVQVSEQYPIGIGASCEESSDIQRKTCVDCQDDRRVVDCAGYVVFAERSRVTWKSLNLADLGPSALVRRVHSLSTEMRI